MNRLLLPLGIFLILGLVLTGCGAATAPSATNTATYSKGAPAMPAAAPTMAAAAMAPLPAGARSATTGEAPGTSSADISSTVDSLPGATDRMIIRNGNMTIIVLNVQDAVDKVTQITGEAGGLVLSTNSRHQDDDLYATVVLKVPAETFDDVMGKLRKLAVKVDSENSSSQDVTEQYVDLDARLKVYQATEQQLLTFLQKTQDVDESLKVYRELTNVRSQIESIQGRKNYLEKSAAMSTITVQVQPQPKEKPIIQETGWSPLRIVRDALRSLVGAMQALVVLLIYAALWLVPILIVVAIPLLILRAIWRRLRRPATR